MLHVQLASNQKQKAISGGIPRPIKKRKMYASKFNSGVSHRGNVPLLDARKHYHSETGMDGLICVAPLMLTPHNINPGLGQELPGL